MIQQATAQAPVVPPAPLPPPAAQPGFVPGVANPGMTVQDVMGLRNKLETLRDELQDAASRRRTISDQLRSSDSKAVPGLERRMAVLDDRIVALERDITETGLLLTSAPPALLAQATTAERRQNEVDPNLIATRVIDDLVPIVAILTVFFLAPLGLAISRLIWKRASAPPRRAVDTGTQTRLDQLQQSVDTIAIEVERISEGQRFVTRLMSDSGRAGADALRVSGKT